MNNPPNLLPGSNTGPAAGLPYSPAKPNCVAVLGASGSIGSAALEVMDASGGLLRPVLLSVRQSTKKLADAALRFHPQTVIVADETADRLPLASLPAGTELLFGSDALEKAVTSDEIDTVLAAIVGGAGFKSALAAAYAGKTLALANKEALVMGGALFMEAVQNNGGRLFPVDSEHSAIYQSIRSRVPLGTPGTDSLSAGRYVKRLILTASGGPFRNHSARALEQVTVEETLAHPTWKMGKKITVDSATMMNKAFEIIEARWLFDVMPEQIAVMIHPQSIIHSMVEFIDSSVAAQMGPPDMKLPIQLALYDGWRTAGPARSFDWSQRMNLELIPADEERFPALTLGREVAAAGGTAGTAVNAANEVAVEAFLAGKIPFTKIVAACRAMLEYHQFEEHPAVEQLFELDSRIRKETLKWISQ